MSRYQEIRTRQKRLWWYCLAVLLTLAVQAKEYLPPEPQQVKKILQELAPTWELLSDDFDNSPELFIALAYRYGRGVDIDMDIAMAMYISAAEKGVAKAQKDLIDLFQKGQEIQQDVTKARYWAKIYASQSKPAIVMALANLFMEGHQHFPKNPQRALELYQDAASEDFVDAQMKLFDIYTQGQVVPQDLNKARYWLEKAAEQNDPLAIVKLGLVYQEGRGVATDNIRAVQLYHKAAELGLSEAQLLLGTYYSVGKFVERSDTEAVKWFRLAAVQNSMHAQFLLGVLYESGSGVNKNLYQAAEWYSRAANQGYDKAQEQLAKLNKKYMPLNIDEFAYRLVNLADRDLQQLAKNFYERNITDPAILDLVARTVLLRYGTDNSYTVDALAWLCKALAQSNNARYRQTLEFIVAEGGSFKLRRHARASLDKLPVAQVEQYQISDSQALMISSH